MSEKKISSGISDLLAGVVIGGIIGVAASYLINPKSESGEKAMTTGLKGPVHPPQPASPLEHGEDSYGVHNQVYSSLHGSTGIPGPIPDQEILP